MKNPIIKFKSPELCFIYGYYHMDSERYNTERRSEFTEGCENVIDKYISKILGIDYKDFIENSEIKNFNKVDAIKKRMRGEFDTWFIGDALTEVIYEACYKENVNECHIVKELRKRYNYFMELYKNNKLIRRISELKQELAELEEQLCLK